MIGTRIKTSSPNNKEEEKKESTHHHSAASSHDVTTAPMGINLPMSMATTYNPMPHKLSEGENATPLEVIGSTATDKLVIIMVGLPATGKTHIAKRICRFLSFFHDIPAQIFNVGDYRRQLCGAKLPSDFYDPQNSEGMAARLMACDAAINDCMNYLKQDGVRVAALDATNSTYERRCHIVATLKRMKIGCKRMFVESVCDDHELLEENIRKVKLSTPDYRDMDPEAAIADFHQRRKNYMTVYEPVAERDGPHVKIINSKQFIVHSIRGYLPLKVVHFVMNLHTLPRTFYLTRHGQSEYNVLGKIGGDSGLSANGLEYAKRLAKFAAERIAAVPEKDNDSSTTTNITADTSNTNDNSEEETTIATKKERPCRLWTSTLRRTKETSQFISHNNFEHEFDNGDTGQWVQFRPMARRNLDELYAGVCDGMTYKEIEQVFPEEFQRRQDDKLAYRYPRGESYMDVTLRLEPLAQEMERIREPVLVIAHQGILRILYAYFMGLDRKDAPYVSIPLNNVIELTPHAYGCHESRSCLMHKLEMENDGQDEPPITSMPMITTKNNRFYNSNKTAYNSSDPDNTNKNKYDGNSNIHVAANDPIMNAPSC